MALAHGVPLVVAGQTEEKPEVAARVEWAQVGINLRTGTPTPAQIQRAVKTLLMDSSYRARIKQFQTQMQQYDAPTIAATLLEQLANTKRPVLKT
jgi:UDP:flavonoid glycosyltransferase YjiC (YdhE family)